MAEKGKRKTAGARMATLLEWEKGEDFSHAFDSREEPSTPTIPGNIRSSPGGPALHKSVDTIRQECSELEKELELLKLEKKRCALRREIIEERERHENRVHFGDGEPNRYFEDLGLGGERKSKALQIVQFLWEEADSSDLEIDFGGAKLNLGKRKAKLGEVTMEQWGYANAKIMHELLEQGKLGPVKNYLKYTADTFRLASRYTWRSIVMYDKEYRERQAAEQFPWGTYIQELRDFQLINKMLQTGSRQIFQEKQDQNSGRRKGPYTPAGKEICRSYNREQCFRRDCRMTHVCTICLMNHPETKHGMVDTHTGPLPHAAAKNGAARGEAMNSQSNLKNYQHQD